MCRDEGPSVGRGITASKLSRLHNRGENTKLKQKKENQSFLRNSFSSLSRRLAHVNLLKEGSEMPRTQSEKIYVYKVSGHQWQTRTSSGGSAANQLVLREGTRLCGKT